MREFQAHGRTGRRRCGDPVGADGIERSALHVPVGTPTFMLTDVEGSARWRGCASDTVGAAVVRHAELLDEAASRHGGARRHREGYNEGLVVAFTRASDAFAAALDMQRAVQSEDWPVGASLKVRIALHTAAQQHDEGSYVDRAVNRCARLRAVAHGGQVVVPGDTRSGSRPDP
jgi:class 3 adenylate cyclase